MSTGTCPSCGSGAIRFKGLIPDNHMFAGNDVGSMPAKLAACRDCHLGFRSPQPPKRDLARLYTAGSESAWSESDEQERHDWRLAAEWVRRVGASSVVDVGCFDGGFLAVLPESIMKAGVEINPGAAQRAAERGVRVVAADLHDLTAVDEKFDLVSAFDVIEHVHDPRDFLTSLAAVTAPGGHIVFATGSLDAPTWRLMGHRYLYSWFLEHISFVSPRWVRRVAPSLDLDVIAIERFSHTADSRFGFLVGSLKNSAYRASPRLMNALRARSANAPESVPPAPPAWTSARDHILVVLRKAR